MTSARECPMTRSEERERRTVKIQIRLTPSEAEELRSLAGKLKVSMTDVLVSGLRAQAWSYSADVDDNSLEA